MIRRPPRSTQSRSSAASDVYKRQILIFPEGGHSRDGQMHPFQLGLGIMVKELGIPVVPIKISGTDRVLPPGAGFPKRGRVTVSFGKPLRFRYEEPAEIVEKTRQAVERL